MVAVGPDVPGQGQGQDQDLDQGKGKPPEWKHREFELREREVASGRFSIVVQFVVAIVALVTVMVALVAACAAREAVDTTREGIERSATEDRLSTAIEAIGGEQPGGRVGGLALLRRHVRSQLLAAINDEEGSGEERRQKRLDAHLLYTAALDVLENYLRNRPEDQANADGGLGYGKPDVPIDNVYAANELKAMMGLRSHVGALHIDSDLSPAPGVDLAKVQLRGQPWKEIDFSWLGGHYFQGIDLRGADLKFSIWGTSSLEDAFLQCADLDGADLTDTNLRGADLRGANISDADFTGAQLGDDTDQIDDDTDFDRVYYDGNRKPKGLGAALPPITQQGVWEGPTKCISHGKYDCVPAKNQSCENPQLQRRIRAD